MDDHLCEVMKNYLSKIQALESTRQNSNFISLDQKSPKTPLSDVFTDLHVYINPLNLFTAHFNAIPNKITEIKIDCNKANAWFLSNYKEDIKDFYFNKNNFKEKQQGEITEIFYFIAEDLLIHFEINIGYVRFLYKKTPFDKVNELVKGIIKFKPNKNKLIPKISLIVNGVNGIDTKVFNLKKSQINLIDNYNDDFLPIHQTIVNRLSKANDKGLVLLHGKPGTGKTSYIRHLISTINKNIIFLPPNMASQLTNPGLIEILIDNPNSIFVIEDAENIVIDREQDGNSPVSALLNVSDGLLADCLNVQIICSFNTDISKIDTALLRKGRMIAKYEFKELEIEKAQQLSHKIGFTNEIYEPMTLTSIYNQTEKDFQQLKTKTPIGFKTTNYKVMPELS